MKVVIEEKTLATERWFPIFDVFLLYIEERRHAFAVEDVDRLLGSAWMHGKDKRDRDLVSRSLTARSHDRLVDKNVIVIDQTATPGGFVDGPYTTLVRPQDCLSFLAQPFSVLVENEWFDGGFLLWMARALGREGLIRAYHAKRFVFRHAGGKGSLRRSASVFSTGVWPTPDGRHAKALTLWACAFLDNDAKYPGHAPNAILVRELEPWVAFVHELDRRSIESYLPYTALARYDRSATFKEQMDALFRLSPDQRRHYNMKTGLQLNDSGTPSKVAYLAAPEISNQERALFGTIPDTDWDKLAPGFGKGLSAIFTKHQHRPVSTDSAAIETSDKTELGRLLDAIYERI